MIEERGTDILGLKYLISITFLYSVFRLIWYVRTVGGGLQTTFLVYCDTRSHPNIRGDGYLVYPSRLFYDYRPGAGVPQTRSIRPYDGSVTL